MALTLLCAKICFFIITFMWPATAKNACEELNLFEDIQTFIDHDGCRGTAFSSAGACMACMLNTESVNLNLVGDYSIRLENKHIYATEGS